MFVAVGYATAHGSTRSIAERIAAGLAERGHRVETVNLAEAPAVARCEAFVIGSAAHRQAWPDEAAGFLRIHRELPRERPVWLFSVGMPAALRGPWRRFAAKEEAVPSERLRQMIEPRGHRLFSGVYLREHTSLAGHVTGRAMGVRYGDCRDWTRIDAWAAEIARTLTAEAVRERRP